MNKDSKIYVAGHAGMVGSAICRRLKAENLKAFLILQVHDEIIAEAEESIAERVAEIIEEEMEKAVDFGVKLTAEAGTGESWYNAKG